MPPLVSLLLFLVGFTCQSRGNKMPVLLGFSWMRPIYGWFRIRLITFPSPILSAGYKFYHGNQRRVTTVPERPFYKSFSFVFSYIIFLVQRIMMFLFYKYKNLNIFLMYVLYKFQTYGMLIFPDKRYAHVFRSLTLLF